MKRMLWTATMAATVVTACNYTEGQCWIEGQGEVGAGVGAGGGPIVPGWGGFGDVPPEPQGAGDPPPPDCNITSDTPCNEKCLSDYVATAEKCTEFKDAAQKRTCDENAYTVYRNCRENCRVQEDKQACVAMFDACTGKGPPCDKEVDVGKTLCAFCLDDCIAKRPYKYSECYQCGFE